MRLGEQDLKALNWALSRLEGCYNDSQRAIAADKLVIQAQENIDSYQQLRGLTRVLSMELNRRNLEMGGIRAKVGA